MPFCPNCGTELSEDNRFCPECGHSFMTVGQARNGRNKKKIAGIIGACIVAAILIAVLVRPPASTVIEAPPLEEGWIRLRIEDVGSIDYPSDFLELQSGDYRELVEEFHIVYEISSSDFTLQPVGMNELELSALEEYRRVIFMTEYLNPGEVIFRAGESYTMSEEELTELESEFEEQLVLQFEAFETSGGMRLVSSVSFEIKEINGMFPMVRTYKRQLSDNPIVLVKDYLFWNYDRVHHLTFSYRVQDEDECADIYEKILYSFRLQN